MCQLWLASPTRQTGKNCFYAYLPSRVLFVACNPFSNCQLAPASMPQNHPPPPRIYIFCSYLHDYSCYLHNNSCYLHNNSCYHHNNSCYHHNVSCSHHNVSCYHHNVSCSRYNVSCYRIYMSNFLDKCGKFIL